MSEIPTGSELDGSQPPACRLENPGAGYPEEWFGREFLRQSDALESPARTALVVIDMQHDFCSPSGVMGAMHADLTGANAILPRIVRLVDEARRAGVLVVFLQNVNLPHARSSGDAEIARRVARRTPPDITLDGSWGAEFVPALTPRDGDVVVVKHRRSGFLHTDLEMVLRANRRDVVVCVGMVTSACVIATAIDAAQRDFYCYVVEDCVAAYDATLHDAAMTVLRGQVAGTMPQANVIKAWSRSARGSEPEPLIAEDSGSPV